jgi:hypothetical protein
MTWGCSRRVELGLDCSGSSSKRSHLWFLGLGALGRCARLLSQGRGHILETRRSQGRHDFRMRTSLAARATGNGVARESVSWLRLVHTCEVQRARRVCPRFVSCCRSRSTRAECPKKLFACPQKQAGGERGLAQSGRPRRAKRHRGSNHGGKTVRSTPASEGIRKGVAVVGLRSMEGASGRRSRSLFTRGRGKRSRPTSPSVIAKSMTCEGWVTGASEVGCSRATTAGENTPCREREQVASAWGAP